MWVLQHHSLHALYMSTIIFFVCLGLLVKWNKLSSNNSHHTSCIHKRVACWEVTWPNGLQTRFCQYTGIPLDRPHWRPLEPQVRWDATGTTLADASIQWCSSGDPVLICIFGTFWRTTGWPLEDHWKHIGNTLATNNSFSTGIPV